MIIPKFCALFLSFTAAFPMNKDEAEKPRIKINIEFENVAVSKKSEASVEIPQRNAEVSSKSNGTASAPVTIDDFKAALEALNGKYNDIQAQDFLKSLKDADITTKREAAMLLAQIWHESGELQYKEEIACTGKDCNGSYPSSPEGGGKPGKSYHGRGYIQLTWDKNYKAASKDLLGNEQTLLENPEKVLEEELAWRTAAWYWKTHVHIMPDVLAGKFGASTKAINGALECSGGMNEKAVKRFKYYVIILKAFKITETPIEEGCYSGLSGASSSNAPAAGSTATVTDISATVSSTAASTSAPGASATSSTASPSTSTPAA